MTGRTAHRLAWGAFLLWALFFVTSAIFDVRAARPTEGGTGVEVAFRLSTAAFAIVAILILARRPRNRIGWILMAIGLAWAEPLSSYGEFAISKGLPGGIPIAALAAPLWAPPIGLMGTVLLLRFPDGALPSPRWKGVEWLAAFAITVTVVAIVVAPRDLSEVGYPDLANPLSIEAPDSVLNALLSMILLIPITILASAISLVVRFRRSTGIERLQLKWLTTAAMADAVIYLAAMLASIDAVWLMPTTPAWVTIIQGAAVISFGLVPIAIGFAILRYRLYDIDRIINRTVVYGLLTILLGSIYFAVVLLPVLLVGSGSAPAGLVAIATLTVAAIFGPARRGIQRVIDRRFYRRRYDAARTLEGFTNRLRDQVDLDALTADLVGVVRETMQPAHASLWLRAPRGLPARRNDLETVEE